MGKRSCKIILWFCNISIACGCEAGIEQELKSDDTPDRRPGVSVLIFSMSSTELQKQVLNRTGQCIMTTPTTSVFQETIVMTK